jgi:PrtD family type I secretion system ABC transporter
MSSQGKPGLAPEIAQALNRCRFAFVGAGIFSGLINLLALTSSIYMLQLYDRAIPSHSIPTLIGLSVVMLILFGAYGVLDVIRTRILGRVGISIDNDLRERVMGVAMEMPLRGPRGSDPQQPIRDLDQVRSFLSGAGPVALFDLPWLPFYMALVWLLHPWLGMLAVGGALVLVGLTILTDIRSRGPSKDIVQSNARRQSFWEASRRNAEAVRALGMTGRVTRKWSGYSESFLADQLSVTDVTSTYGTISKVLRLVLQSAVLGLGAYLVIMGQATGGVMIAASILVSRALAPIEIVIGNWRGFISARQSSARLSQTLRAMPQRNETLELPAPTEALHVEGVSVAPPGQQVMVVSNVSFKLDKGTGLGIIGPSASGKSSLARALIGAWAPARGCVRLDGATLDQWSPDALGVHIGYLPQDIELFEGTVAENIARFDPDATSEAVIAAAQAARAHEMILRLPNGYDTQIREAGSALSAGQRQRVGLARALYGNPFLVVLDEPNSNLDAEGDAALAGAIGSIRARGGIVVVVAHRPSALGSVDNILVMNAGKAQAFGPKEEILPKVMPQAYQPPQPLHAVQAAAAARGAAAAQAGGALAARNDLAAALARGQPAQEGNVRLRIITEGNRES